MEFEIINGSNEQEKRKERKTGRIELYNDEIIRTSNKKYGHENLSILKQTPSNRQK